MHQIYKEQWTLSTAVGQAEGVPLRSMSTFVFPVGKWVDVKSKQRDSRADPVFRRAWQVNVQ